LLQPVIFLLSYSLAFLIASFLEQALSRLKVFPEKQTHLPQHQEKRYTPAMGGLAFILPLLILLPFITTKEPILAMLLFGLLGMIDDMKKAFSSKKRGLKARFKFIFQILIAAIVAVYLETPVLWGILVLLATVNAVNLTDGIDGAAAGIVVLMLIGALLFLPGHLSILAALLGSLLAFKYFNQYPARLFMGDTGSLALGGFLGTLALQTGTEIYLLTGGLVLVIETLSVMMQVIYFKISKGRRLLLMSPLHHHLELKGYKETQINQLFTFLTTLGILLYLNII